MSTSTSRRLGRGLAAVGAIGIGGVTVLAVGAPAAAASCATTTPASTLLSGGKVCQIRITASGTYNFPESLKKLSAVLVGAGGGSTYNGDESSMYASYAGGGGEVVYVDEVDLGADLAITVGESLDDAWVEAGSTTLGAATARGGNRDDVRGMSGARMRRAVGAITPSTAWSPGITATTTRAVAPRAPQS